MRLIKYWIKWHCDTATSDIKRIAVMNELTRIKNSLFKFDLAFFRKMFELWKATAIFWQAIKLVLASPLPDARFISSHNSTCSNACTCWDTTTLSWQHLAVYLSTPIAILKLPSRSDWSFALSWSSPGLPIREAQGQIKLCPHQTKVLCLPS